MLRQFGNYLLDEEIARGGMGRVYRARLRGLGGFEKPLVVKQVLPELAGDPAFVRMFVEEAKTLVQMSHPHVVPVYELGVVDGVYFLAMEHVDGATLAEILERGPLEAPLTAHLGIQVAEALDYAHQTFGLVHRDVTPRNVIVDARGHARLLDFGIAARAESSVHDPVFGSPGYMSPEQARGDSVTGKSDLFALGIVMHEALTGRRLFHRDTADAARKAVLEGVTGALAPNDLIPEAIRAVVNATLSPDPGARPGSARDVARRLRAWLSVAHPEGVAVDLGVRAAEARDARRQSLRPVLGDLDPANAPSGMVRTLATSPILESALGAAAHNDRAPSSAPEASPGTERMNERHTAPEEEAPKTEPLPARATRRPRSAWYLAAGLGIASTLVAAGFVLEERTASPPRTAPAVAKERPQEGELPARRPASPQAEDPALPAPPPDETPRGKSTAPAEVPAPTRPAMLTLNAVPWAEAHLDGRALGNTPRRDVSVRPGNHRVELRCPPLGRTATTHFHAEPGQRLRVLADLSVDPPEIRVR